MHSLLMLSTLPSGDPRTPSAHIYGGMLLGALALASCHSASQLPSQPSTTSASPSRSPQAVEKVSTERVLTARPHFAVQVAAFNQRADAERLAARLSGEFGYQTMVAPVELSGKTFFRVRMLVRTRDEAENLAIDLSSKTKVSAWIDPLP